MTPSAETIINNAIDRLHNIKSINDDDYKEAKERISRPPENWYGNGERRPANNEECGITN